MSELLTLQDLANGHLDVKALGEAANGDENTIVTTRTGNTYPSAERAINIMFKNGGLPATPFATKADMVASNLSDGSYAVVTQDTESAGLYVKQSGGWVKSNYHMPAIIDGTPNNFSESGAVPSWGGLLDYLEGAIPKGSFVSFGELRENSDIAEVVVGYSATSRYLMDPNHTSIKYLIPDGCYALHISSLTTPSFCTFEDANGIQSWDGIVYSSGSIIGIPSGTKYLYITITFAGYPPQKDGDGFYVYGSEDIKGADPFVRESDLKDIASIAVNTPNFFDFEYVSRQTPQNFSQNLFPTEKPLAINGRLRAEAAGIAPSTGSKIYCIPIPSNSKSVIIKAESDAVRFGFWQIDGRVVFGPTSKVNGGIEVNIPESAAYLVIDGYISESEKLEAADSIIFKGSGVTSLVTVDGLKDELQKLPIAKDKYTQIMLGSKLYTFEGDDLRIYKESIFSGYNPVSNFSIEFAMSGTTVQDRGRYAEVLKQGAVTVEVYDDNRKLVDYKSTDIYKKPMPTALNRNPAPSDKLKVLFIGDSLIHANQNLIGREWLRMLNTNDGGSTKSGVIYPQAYGLAVDSIELVGKQGTSESKFEYGNRLRLMMEHDVDTVAAKSLGNPFYYSDSTEPNELDADGWNKRVDIVRYLQDVCGEGKYPDYIYIASGVNDIVDHKWNIDALQYVRERLKKVLKRIKDACDEIAGGNSNVQILLMNHQFYPLNRGAYGGFKPAHQRRVWSEHYKQYESMISNDSVDGVKLSSFVRFVDCASSFDMDNGYATYNKTVNPRSPESEALVVDTVHMGPQGAAMFADALLRDFLYHECS